MFASIHIAGNPKAGSVVTVPASSPETKPGLIAINWPTCASPTPISTPFKVILYAVGLSSRLSLI